MVDDIVLPTLVVKNGEISMDNGELNWNNGQWWWMIGDNG